MNYLFFYFDLYLDYDETHPLVNAHCRLLTGLN